MPANAHGVVRQQVRKFVRRILQDLRSEEDRESGSPAHIFSNAGMGSMFLDPTETDDLMDLVDRLQAEHTSGDDEDVSVLSGSRAADSLRRALLVGANGSGTLDERVNAAMASFDEAMSVHLTSWTVCARVEGLPESSLPFRFGPVEFYLGSTESLAPLEQRLSRCVQDTADPSDKKARLWSAIQSDIAKHFHGQVIAEVSADALDEDAAVERCGDSLRLSLDVLNFLIDAHCLPEGSFVYRPGEACKGKEMAIATADDGRCSQRFSIVGPLPPNLSMARSTSSKRAAWDTASALLQADRSLPAVARLTSAMRWCGRARTAPSAAEATLNYAIALEALLLDRHSKSEVKVRFEKRVAAVLVDSPAEQRRLKKHAGKLYEVRCNIAHNGHYRVRADHRLAMRSYALACTQRLLMDPAYAQCPSDETIEVLLDGRWRA